MATPSQKSPAMEAFLEAAMQRSTKIDKNLCVTCSGPATSFRNAISRKEYSISGMCQQCQDDIFGKD